MAVLPVVKFPEKVLKTKAEPVPRITAADRRLVRDMIETMHSENGVGLAANQIGVLKQLFVAIPDTPDGEELVFFNPRIVRKEGLIKEFEGCLSIPEFYEPVKRARQVWIEAMTLDGRSVQVKGEGLHARIFQHEIDHLNGILFIDRLGLLKARAIKKKLRDRSFTPSA